MTHVFGHNRRAGLESDACNPVECRITPRPDYKDASESPEVTLIIATSGRPDLLHRTLDSLVEQSKPVHEWELLLADNRPEVSVTRDAVAPYLDRLPITIVSEFKPGKNFALNRALEQARGSVIVFSDDDVIASPDWLATISKMTRAHPEYDMFGGRIFPHWPEGEGPPNYDLGHPLLTGVYVIADRGEKPIPISGYDFWGPNMWVRRELFDMGHRFDPSVGPDGSTDYIMGSETEFTTRMESLGHRALYVPSAVVRHQVRYEQLSEAWIRERVVRIGRWESRRWPFPEARRIFGVPLFCYRGLLNGMGKWLRGAVSRKPALSAEGLALWLWVGRISQYRRDHLNR